LVTAPGVHPAKARRIAANIARLPERRYMIEQGTGSKPAPALAPCDGDHDHGRHEHDENKQS